MTPGAAYRALFTHREIVADLLNGFAAREWIDGLDLATLEPCKEVFVTEDLRVGPTHLAFTLARSRRAPWICAARIQKSRRWAHGSARTQLHPPALPGAGPRRPDEGRMQTSERLAERNLAAAVFTLDRSRTPTDMRRVVDPLHGWLGEERQETLRRSFAEWVGQVLMPHARPKRLLAVRFRSTESAACSLGNSNAGSRNGRSRA